MDKIKVMTIFGTRPEAIKMAPLVKELEGRPEFESCAASPPSTARCWTRCWRSLTCTHSLIWTSWSRARPWPLSPPNALLGMEGVFGQVKPDLVLVHGDTSTTFAGALSAFYHQIAVGHVEAGLRTYDRYSPFPEEMNRTLVGRLAQLHFCPTQSNRRNLEAEGICSGVFVTGNTVIDALRTTVREDYCFSTPVLNELDYQRKKVIVVTCHRRENYGAPMEQIMSALRRLALSFDGQAEAGLPGPPVPGGAGVCPSVSGRACQRPLPHRPPHGRRDA